jgi:tetratricopeptide (TPR) repeat protein
MIVLEIRRPMLWAAFFFVAASWLCAQTDQLIEQSRRGKELMAQGRYEEAIPIYRDMVKAMPQNPGLVLNLALAEQMAGHPDRAIPHFTEVLKLQPDNEPALTSLGMARLQLNQPAEALIPLRKLVTLNPKDVNARGMLAGAEMSVNKFADAATQYRELTTLAPSDPKTWYGLGKAYEASAGVTFDRLTKVAPESGYVAFLVADSRLQRRQYRSAFFFYREAEKQMPDLPGLHAGIARVYRSTGHEDWAAAEEKRDAELIAKVDCRQQAQACHFTKGEYLAATKTAATSTMPSLFWAARAYNELAVRAFAQLGQLPESPELHAVKAQILHDHGQHLESAKEWQAALTLAPDHDDPRLKTELASALFMGRDYNAAIPLLEHLLPTDPQSPDLNFMLGESLWRTQQADKALPHLNAALKENTGMLPAHAALGLALVSLNRNDEAVSHLEKALALDDDGSLHYSLAKAYQAAGNTERARENMQEYEKIRRRNAEVDANLAKEAEIVAPTQAPAR